MCIDGVDVASCRYAVIGQRHRHHRRVGPLRHRRAGGQGLAAGRDALGRAVGRAAVRPPRWRALRLPAAPRTRPSAPAHASQLPRQHRRTEAVRRHRRAVALGGRQSEAGAAARPFVIVDQFIDRSFAREKSFFGDGHRRACLDGAPGLPAPRRCAGSARRASLRPAGYARRHLSGDGRPAVLHPGRKRALSLLGLQRDRHDQHAGGEARPRGGAELRNRGDGDRLRLLASGPRPRHVEAVVACCWTTPTRRAHLVQRSCRRSASRATLSRPAATKRSTTPSSRASHMRDPRLSAKLDAVAGTGVAGLRPTARRWRPISPFHLLVAP